MYAYGKEGNSGMETPAAVLEMKDMADNTIHKQGWSVGNAQEWYPNPADGGKTILSYKEGAMIRRNSNFAQLVASLENAGFPKDRNRAGDLSQWDGMVCVVSRVKAKEINGVPSKTTVTLEDGRVIERDRKIMLCEKVIKLPGAKDAGAGKGKAKGKAAETAPAQGESADEATKDKAVSFIVDLLSDPAHAAGIAKKNLTLLAMQKIKADEGRNAVVKLVTQDSFLGSAEAPWSYEAGIVRLPA
jgi:hypothetical protein